MRAEERGSQTTRARGVCVLVHCSPLRLLRLRCAATRLFGWAPQVNAGKLANALALGSVVFLPASQWQQYFEPALQARTPPLVPEALLIDMQRPGRLSHCPPNI